ncbi:hypothetical protein Metfor_0723 [Methanoregula formicica SMSP]|uniref:Uncharacterized protein n=1 Tax=Methanoregula formicica (strain DSM 22288 / NBRC 105244 / SMSP) TaxID=593750 RepID=L0HEP3_METFS|nr:hypothetical protein Metfor_0723 [Methanoregula formicica SMSP]
MFYILTGHSLLEARHDSLARVEEHLTVLHRKLRFSPISILMIFNILQRLLPLGQ